MSPRGSKISHPASELVRNFNDLFRTSKLNLLCELSSWRCCATPQSTRTPGSKSPPLASVQAGCLGALCIVLTSGLPLPRKPSLWQSAHASAAWQPQSLPRGPIVTAALPSQSHHLFPLSPFYFHRHRCGLWQSVSAGTQGKAWDSQHWQGEQCRSKSTGGVWAVTRSP
jgi:hypothetical protein